MYRSSGELLWRRWCGPDSVTIWIRFEGELKQEERGRIDDGRRAGTGRALTGHAIGVYEPAGRRCKPWMKWSGLGSKAFGGL